MAAFRSFCLENREALQNIMSARRVQTNEVGRCTCLLPAFGLASAQAGGRPLALVEIGASAGLNLLWDRYQHDDGEGRCCGDPGSPVRIRCRPRGDRRPPVPVPFPAVASRLGLELDPIDVRDPGATLWLRALIWPEHRERDELLERALAVARRDPPAMIAGDALDHLPAVLASIPPDAIPCLFHRHTTNQFSPEGRAALALLLAEWAGRRDLFRISLEGRGGEFSLLELVSFRQGVRNEHPLARCSGHGEWIEWLDGELTGGRGDVPAMSEET